MLSGLNSKIVGACLVAAAICGFAPTASATVGNGTLLEVVIESGTSFARVRLSGAAIGGRPACHNAAYTTHYGFDISTPKGKALLSTATAAMLAGKTVSLGGVGTCTNLGNVSLETLASLIVNAT